MNPRNKWLKILGYVLNALIAALLIFAAYGKLSGSAPPEMQEKLKEYGLENRLQLIGLGELTCAVLLLLPWVSPLGILMTSGFWGGVICIHLTHNEDIIAGSVFLVLTWIGGFLRGSVPLVTGGPKAT
jgi:hypothetical protein